MPVRFPAWCRQSILTFFDSNTTVSVCTLNGSVRFLVDAVVATKARFVVEYVCQVAAAWFTLGVMCIYRLWRLI
jgi:hypothetical protein